MTNYKYYMPTEIFFGEHTIHHLITLVNKFTDPNVLIVTDKGIISSKTIKPIIDILDDNNVKYVIFSDVEPNPKSSTVEFGLNVAKENDINLIIAVGGGSSIDAAKAIAAMATNEGKILDYEGVGVLINDSLPTIIIPTTAGTGSEVTASIIITDEDTLFKVAIISEKVFPTYAILDPSLTLTCPKSITNSTGMDALTHAIESYLSKQTNGIVKALALQAISLIEKNIAKAYYNGTDITSRKNMLEASMLAGLCFSQTRLGNVHAISQAFGGVYDIPHGIANAVLLPYILNYNYLASIEEFNDIAKALDIYNSQSSPIVNAQNVIRKIMEMNKLLEIPNNTKVLGVNLENIDKLIEDSMRSGNILVNPRLTNSTDIKKIIEDSYNGFLEIKDFNF